MGLTYAEITLVNADENGMARRGLFPKDEVKKIVVTALVDSGAYMLTISDCIRKQLNLNTMDQQTAELADGSLVECDIVGPVNVHFKNRFTSCLALVLHGITEPLLGAIPLEGMDVLLDPKSQQLIVNPAHPYIAVTRV